LSKSRLLLTMAVVQSVFLVLWGVCNLLKINLLLDYWFLVLFVAVSVSLMVTFAREFRSGCGRPEIAVSIITILLTSVINSYSYFTTGNHDTMDFSLIILAFPVLVLMIGKVVLYSAQREYQITYENMTLRIEGELLNDNYIYLCANKLVNAILTDKISEAEKQGIRVKFSANLPEKLNVQGNDLCSLLVNMLDNAIEACTKLPDGQERNMDISIKLKNDFIYFGVFNSSASSPIIEDEEFVTLKEDQAKHGYGIAIMRRIVRKYDGAFDIILSENSFLVKAALRNTSTQRPFG